MYFAFTILSARIVFNLESYPYGPISYDSIKIKSYFVAVQYREYVISISMKIYLCLDNQFGISIRRGSGTNIKNEKFVCFFL